MVMVAAANSSSLAGNLARRRQWRYTWESLPHIPFLRLYLFHPALSDATPSDLRADLRLDDSLLLVAFSLAGNPVSLRVPVPRVLVDPSVPPECRSAGDHVEVRLALVLAVDHPVVAAAFPPLPGAEPPAPLAPHHDIKRLSSGDVHLYCKSCSARLTNQPLRNIVEMPSLNWEDVADNWFGGCCTSFGGAGEKLVSRYINAYGRLDGTSLLDATSISIKMDYLEMDLARGIANSISSNASVALQEAVSAVHEGQDHTTEEIMLDNSEEKAYSEMRIDSSHVHRVGVEGGPCVSNTEQNGDTLRTDRYNTIQMENGVDVNSEKYKNDYYADNMEETTKETELSLADPWNCCCDSRISRKAGDDTSELSTQRKKTQTILDRDYKLTKNISLGSSFIVKASNLLNAVDWVELLCVHCLSPLGSFPSQCSHAPVDGRVRLFKCYTSSNLPVRGPYDVFRGHSLERLFVNMLLEIAEDEISFRTVVRDLKTKRAMLQIVLLSSKAWLFSGYCFDNIIDGSDGAADLQPAVKLLYFNCNNSSEADLRTIEEWSSKYRAEELYMMERQITELSECLSSAMDKFPLSCSSLEGMHLSSLER